MCHCNVLHVLHDGYHRFQFDQFTPEQSTVGLAQLLLVTIATTESLVYYH